MSQGLARKIKAVREQENLSQEEMATSLVYASKTTISKLETGSVEIAFDQLGRLVSEYDMDVNSFFPLGRLDKRRRKGCPICEKLTLLEKGIDPTLIKELKTGYVAIAEQGALFLSKIHASSLHEIPFIKRMRFLSELALVEEAVYLAYKAKSIEVKISAKESPHLVGEISISDASALPLEARKTKLAEALDVALKKHYYVTLDKEDFEEEEKRYKIRLSSLLGKEVEVIVDRPLGSAHPDYPETIYPINYGHIEPMVAPDGDYQDAYLLGLSKPVDSFKGEVIALLYRSDDIEGKLIVAPKGLPYAKEEIEEAIAFQERYFSHILVLKSPL